ncbi:MAG: single-stranded DNA-binding protein [Actinomycetota bacterium]
MDLNLVVIGGRLAAPPEIREFDSGGRLMRLLVTVRSDEPTRRVDVIPVTLWDPPQDLIEGTMNPGDRVWVAGAVQRRFWAGPEGRRSRIEVVADQVCRREPERTEA